MRFKLVISFLLNWKKLTLLFSFLVLLNGITFSQRNLFDGLDTSQAAQKERRAFIEKEGTKIQKFIDELIDEELFRKSIQTRRVRKNRNLVDSMETYYADIGIDFTTYSKLNVDELWANVFNSRKVYSTIQGRYDISELDDQYGRSIYLKIEVDTISSLSELSIIADVRLNLKLNDFLTKKGYNPSEIQDAMNKYLKDNVNLLVAESPNEFREPVIKAMSWMYSFLEKTLDEKDISTLIDLKEAEEMASEDFLYAREDFQVQFTASPNQVYGFDNYRKEEYGGWKEHYPTVTMGKQGDAGVYYVPYKSLKRNSAVPDYVDVSLVIGPEDNLTMDSIIFKDQRDKIIAKDLSAYRNDKFNSRLLLKGFSNSRDKVYAYWGNKKLGLLKIKTYGEEKNHTVTIVPVGRDLDKALTAKTLEERLNKVMKQGLQRFSVTLKPTFKPSSTADGKTVFDFPKNKGLGQYTPQMRALRQEYFQTYGDRGLGNLIFIIDGFDDSKNTGYMPQGRGMGFITHGSIGDGHTLAHELGHGAFKLEHIFEEGLTEGTTRNLMDYVGSAFSPSEVTHLTYKQWGNMRRLGNFIPNYFDEVEESASTNLTVTGTKIIKRTISDLVCASMRSENTAQIHTRYNKLRNKGASNNENEILFGVSGIIQIQFYNVTQEIINVSLDYEERDSQTYPGRVKSLRFRDLFNSEFYFDIHVLNEHVGKLKDIFKNRSTRDRVFNEEYAEFKRLKKEGGDVFKEFIYSSSTCLLARLSISEKVDLLKEIANFWIVDQGDEELVIRLMESIRTPTAIKYFVENTNDQNLWKELLTDIDNDGLFYFTRDNLDLFAGHILRMSNTYYSENRDKIVISGALDANARRVSTLSDYTIHNAGKVTIKHKEREYGCGLGDLIPFTDCGYVEETLFDKEPFWNLVTVSFGSTNKYANITASTTLNLVPVGLIAYYAQKQLTGEAREDLFTAIDIALLAVGVGEISAATKALSRGASFARVTRLVLGGADYVTACIDLTCNDKPDSGLCNEWRKVSIYANLGLLGIGGINQIDDLIRRTKPYDTKGVLDNIENGRNLVTPNVKQIVNSIEEVPNATRLLAVRQGKGEALLMKEVREISQGEKVEDLVREVIQLTKNAGKEHAVVKLADNRRVIVSGGRDGIYFTEGQIKLIYGHTHTTSRTPSVDDYKILKDLDQSKQYVVYDNGRVVKLANTGRFSNRVIDASSDATLIARVKELRQSLTSAYKKSGNFGYAEVNVSGVSKKEFFSHSRIDELTGTLPERVPEISLKPKTADEIYPWTTEPAINGTLIERNIDTEYKILTELTQKIGDNPNVTGTVKLFTERAPCPSCSNVIELFKERYRLLDIEIIHNNGTTLTNF